MTCDKSCQATDARTGKPLPRIYPLAKFCCAIALYARTPEQHRQALLEIVGAQLGPEHAQRIRDGK